MATYRLGGVTLGHDDDSDISPLTSASVHLYDTSTTPNESFFRSGLIGAGATIDERGFVSQSTVPNNDSWEDGGTQTFTVYGTADNSDCDVRIRMISVNSSGTILQTGSYGSAVTLGASSGASVNITCSAPTWTHTEACGNRMVFELEYTDTREHGGSGSYDLQTGQDSNFSIVVTDISEDAGGCAGGAARRIFVSYIH